jgi:RimJ/RimL family protein N-acetyltransferase
MNIHYRKLLPADSKQYRDVRLDALQKFPENFGSNYETESAKPKLAFEIAIEQQADNNFIIGAFDGEKLIGICGFAQETGPKIRHRGLIIQMYIRPQYQGKGLGFKLLQTTVDEAFKIPEVEQLALGVISHNVNAAKIYERAGFKEFGMQPNYLKIGDKYLHQRLMLLGRKS